jgi:hypothetical protein
MECLIQNKREISLSDKDLRENKETWNLIPQTSTGKKATTTVWQMAD